jgi:hypothetical protein
LSVDDLRPFQEPLPPVPGASPSNFVQLQ